MGFGKLKIWLLIVLSVTLIIFGIDVYSTNVQNIEKTQDFLEGVFGQPVVERPSPCDRVAESDILVFKDRIIINFKDAEWATFTDSNSMDPVIDIGANALEYIPESEQEICVGDIVSYKSKYASGTIIHRVIEISYDDNGWYARMKGDNNPYTDPGKVRFDQVQRVVIGIIY